MTADTNFWNEIAEKYAASPVQDPDAFDRKIAIHTDLIEPDHVLLNIGCGTGSLSLRLAPTNAEIHGLDIASEMIRIARDKASKQGVDNVQFHVGAFDDSFDVFGAGSLDGIGAYSVLHLMEDRDAALAQIYSLLKPGGFFVSSTVCLAESWAPYGALLTVMRWIGKAPMVHIISKQTLQDELARAGFVDIQSPDVGAESTVGFLVAMKPR